MKNRSQNNSRSEAERKDRRIRFNKAARKVLELRRNPKYRDKPKQAVAEYALTCCMTAFERATRHFWLVVRHKWYVFLYCAYAGIPWRGFMHDWSKFSPTEFLGSIKYFNGRRSPVGLCRILEGYSPAWLHHKGRNRHHFEFWVDVVSIKGELPKTPDQWFTIPMPYEFALESICDTIGASRAYNGRNFSYEVLYKWWKRSRTAPSMHPKTKRFADFMYETMRAEGNCSVLKKAREIYEQTHKDD